MEWILIEEGLISAARILNSDCTKVLQSSQHNTHTETDAGKFPLRLYIVFINLISFCTLFHEIHSISFLYINVIRN